MSDYRIYPENGRNNARSANQYRAGQTPSGARRPSSASPQQPRRQQGAPATPRRQPAAAPYQQSAHRQPVQPARPQRGPVPSATPSRAPKKSRSTLWRVVFWVALAVFLAAVLALGAIAFSYWQGRDANSSTAQAFPEPSDTQLLSLGDLTVDWDALLAVNPDTVGWVYIPGTVVNYPIVQTDNNETYLKTDFQGETNWFVSFGTIFLEAENAGDFSDQNSIVYGHNMNDGAIFGGEGSMFSAIASMDDPAAFNAARTVYVLTPQGNYRLRTFSLVHTSATDPLVQTSFATAEDMTAYVQDKMDRTVQQPEGALPAAADIGKVFTFSTCDNLPSDGRYVLFCYVDESTVAGVQAVGGSIDGATTDAAASIGEAAQDIS